ncbi:hypothetical protein SAMD00023353_2301200 [Rosellinia necatrix]|uniref:Uncharacterized protein n=1 Tax=Rosellinia necatrix TaxID=77044 RepID=A0A1W2TGD3_ROSNE|nr:hypothetical protein SAMD00023353_2301200 [Rosellinia necatrix]
MVSFFGLKIGGEKKKKSSKDLQISSPQLQNLDDPNALDSNFFDFKGVPNPSYEASVYSLSRQESEQSSRSIKNKFKGLKAAPFASSKFGSSTTDLPAPPGLRHHASNPSLGRHWTAGSTTSLNIVPPSFHPLARPSTSDGRSKTWVNPLDVHFARDSSKPGFKGPLSPALTARDEGQPGTPLSAASKSPLGQYELKLDLPDDVSSFADFGDFKEIMETPAPLRIKKPASTRSAAESHLETQSQKPPSPPQSIADRGMFESSASEFARVPLAKVRPPGSQGHDSIPSGREELKQNASKFGSVSLPSPSTTPRRSEEKLSTPALPPRPASPPAKRANPKPIIQNVRAKRDTLTINPQRRRSLQMKIEAAESSNVPTLSLMERPKTSSNSGRPIERPPPLTLNMGFRLGVAGRNGPRSAPFLRNPTRSPTPTSTQRPPRPQMRAWMGSNPPTSAKETHEPGSGVGSPTGSSVYDDDDDDEVYRHPPSPESTSPVIPLTGPLASPCFPPPSQFPLSYSSSYRFPRNDGIETERDISPTTPPVPPRSLRRNPPTPDSSYRPLPSPAMPSFDRAAISPSPADSRVRSESESDSLCPNESLSPRRTPGTNSSAESPTFRSFSRPWSPTASGELTSPPIKRAETAGVLSGGGDFGGGLRPPPRPAPTKTLRTEAGTLKPSTTRVGDNGLGGGFI